MENKILEDINKKYGHELEDPDKCKEIYEKVLAAKQHHIDQLDLNNPEASFSKLFKETKELSKECEEICANSKDVVEEVNENLNEIEETRNELQKRVGKINELQTTLQYIKVIQKIEFFNVELEREFRKKDDEQCATIYANLCEISRNLSDFTGVHLKHYLRDVIHHWHNILKEKLAQDFETILNGIKWPFTNANFSLQLPPANLGHKLQIVSEYLLQIELPSETTEPSVVSSLSNNFPPLCLPILFLIKPLRKRFMYHFYGVKQTNRSDKPEWYFTQILTWVRDHRDFVEKWLQPVVDRLGLHHINAKLDFTRGLVQIAIEKLHSEIPNAQYDDFTFSHNIDEALGFDKELRDVYEYPANQPSVLSVLTQAQIFVKWLTMEKKFALEKMDSILSSNTSDPFEILTTDVEDLKITTCADAFITLLQTITARCESLPQPGHRLQFLDLQLELLDDFRLRLAQILSAESGDIIESKIPFILNTIHYMENVLLDWGNMLHYLNLYYYKTQFEKQKSATQLLDDTDDLMQNFESETVFAETLALYSHMRKDILFKMCEHVMLEVRIKIKKYTNERWSLMKNSKNLKSLSITPSACPFLEVLARRLHQLQKYLTIALFNTIWKNLAQLLDDYLFENLILENRFNEDGAMQLKYDVHRNLLPLFSQFTQKPENYFRQTVEAVILLNITKGSALLLRETILALEGATGPEDTRSRALCEIGVKNMNPKISVTVLNQRSDITVNRLNSID